MNVKWVDPTMYRFLMVGIVNTIVGTGTMFFLYNLVGCSYWVSSAANYVVGGFVSFFLNKFFTFKDTTRSWSQFLKFALTVTVCYLIGYGVAKPVVLALMEGYSTSMQENCAMCVGMCLYVVLNYLIQRFFVFNHQKI